MQNAKFTKILSFILSMALVVGFLPALAPSVAEAANAEDTVIYDFKYYGEDEKGSTENMVGTKYEYNAPTLEDATYGYWEYLSHCFVSGKNSTRYKLNGNWQVSFQGTVQAAGGYGDWIAFKVKGLTTGLYDVKMRSYYYNEARNHEVGLYLLPTSIFENTTLTTQNAIHGIIKDGVISENEEGQIIGEPKFLYTELKNTTNPGYINFGSVQVRNSTADDEWVLAVKLESLAATYTGTSDYIFFPEIVFTRQPLGALTVEADDATVGEKIDLNVSLVDAENAPITDAQITVACESDNVVVADNGDIYAVAPGTAEITVAAEKDGKIEQTTANVTISGGESVFASGDASYMFKWDVYDIASDDAWIYKNDGTKNPLYTTYGNAGRMWKFLEATCSIKDGGGNLINISKPYVATGTNENEWSAWCVKVPKAGKYVVDMSGLCYSSGGMAEIYMAPYTEGMSAASAISPANLVGTMDEYRAAGDPEKDKVVKKTIGLFDAKTHGEYIMIIRGVKNAAGKTYLHISDITLNGSDYYIAPDYKDVFGNRAVYVEKDDSGSFTAHFAAGINSLNYEEVGFKVSINGASEKVLSTTAAYSTVTVAGGDVSGAVTAEELNLDSGYIFTKSEGEIAAGSTIEFTPYAIELDGTEVTGKTYSVTVSTAQ